MMDINMDLLRWSIIFWIKKLLVELLKMRIYPTRNQQKNCTNKIMRKFEETKVPSLFIDNIWSVDLADMQTLKTSFKHKKGIKINNAFQKMLNNLIINQTRHEYMKGVNFTVDQ